MNMNPSTSPNMNMNMNMNMGMGMPGMKMYFHTGYEEYILFEETLTKSKGGFAGACIVVVVWALLYEVLKFAREELCRRQKAQVVCAMVVGGPAEKTAVQNSVKQMCSKFHVLQTLLHVLQIFMSYCLMLVFMTFNIYLGLCVLIGSAIGYFLVGWRRSVGTSDQNEHCH